MIGFNKKMNDEEMKEFGKYIISDTCNKLDLNVNIIISKLVEFYKTKHYKEEYSDEQLEDIVGLASNDNNEILIITDNLQKKYEIIDFTFSIFHEIMHMIINQKDPTPEEYDITMFAIDLENIIINNNEQRYHKYHDMFREEIEADLFAAKVSKDYSMNKIIKYMRLKKKPLNKKQIDIYKTYLEFMELYSIYRLNAYNVCVSIDYYNMLVQKDPEILSDTNCIINRFYEKDGTYKKLFDIIKDPIINKHDFAIKSYILASRSFLNEINFDSLSYFELNYLLKSLDYVYKDSLLKSNKCQKIEKYSNNFRKKNNKIINNSIIEDTFDNVSWVNTSIKKYNYIKKILDKYKYHNTSLNKTETFKAINRAK